MSYHCPLRQAQGVLEPTPTIVTMGKPRGQGQRITCQDHTVSAAEPSCPTPTHGRAPLGPGAGLLPSSGPCRIRYRVAGPRCPPHWSQWDAA